MTRIHRLLPLLALLTTACHPGAAHQDQTTTRHGLAMRTVSNASGASGSEEQPIIAMDRPSEAPVERSNHGSMLSGEHSQAAAVAAAAGTQNAANTLAEEASATSAAATAANNLLAATSGLPIEAARGGLYRSPSGDIEVEIPPGALDHDATVRFVRAETTLRNTADGVTPGVVVYGDWGGAKLNPRARIGLKARVDDRFLPALQAAAPGTGPGTLGMTHDAAGAWYLPISAHADSNGSAIVVDKTPINGTKELQEQTILPYKSVTAGGEANLAGDQHSADGGAAKPPMAVCELGTRSK